MNEIEAKHIFIGSIILMVSLLLGIVIGFFASAKGNIQLMGEYDLYNCIYNNAQSNSFTQNPYLIQKIQDECICFRQHNYTNLPEANC